MVSNIFHGCKTFTGMMTGQILGGTPVMQAARYQILIIYFIAMCSFGTIIMELKLALRVCFDSKVMLRTDVLQKRVQKPSIFSVILSAVTEYFGKNESRPRASSYTFTADDESTVLAGGLTVLTASPDATTAMEKPILSVEGLSYGFKIQQVEGDEKLHDEENTFRTLFKNLSFQIYAGDMALVTGPSGAGKSTLLRIIAGLTNAGSENIQLDGNTQASFTDMPHWRRTVRYVPQTKVDIPGTPNDFLSKITTFSAWKAVRTSREMRSYFEMKNKTRDLIRKWGMNIDLLNSEWKVLSGGESQRMLVAISLASLCEGGVILLDESTSALDFNTKLLVEKSVREYCTRLSAVALWISHDPGQKNRMKLDR